MNAARKARIRSELRNKGIYWTDAQIEAHAAKIDAQSQVEQGQPDALGEPADAFGERDLRADDGFFGESALDFVGAGVWGALDTASFGLAGLGLKKAAPSLYEDMMEELHDTGAGRVGATLGSLAGFMTPLGAVAKGTSLAARTARTALQSRAIKAGKAVASPTTRTIQRQAAKKLQSEVAKAGKNITLKEAESIARATSDDIIGFATKGKPWWQRPFIKGQAHHFEYGQSVLNNAKATLQSQMPGRLGAELSSRGVKLGKDAILKMSDDMVEMLGKKSYNNIAEAIGGRWGGKFSGPLAKIGGAMAQEAVNFGIIGTVMDGVQAVKGELDWNDMSFAQRASRHAFMGGAFGFVPFVPGGRNRKLWQDIYRATGSSTKKLNKQVSAMSLDEAKAFARQTMLNDKSVNYVVNGTNISIKELKKGRGLTAKDLPALKDAIKAKNIETLSQFRDLSRLGPEIRKDLIGSIPRMVIGGVAFNIEAMQEGAFYNLGPQEAAFHFGLGMVMSKTGRPLIHGKKLEKFGVNWGEKDYYYDSDLRDLSQKMDREYHTGENIGDIIKHFDGNLITDWLEVNPIQDVENIIQILKDKNVIYDKSDTGLLQTDDYNDVALRNRELLNLVDPLIPIFKARNIEMNPKVTKKELESALKDIQNTESTSLTSSNKDGTASKVFLNTRNNIVKSIHQGAEAGWKDIESSLLDNVGQQLAILTGNPDYLGADGRMKRINIDDRGRSTKEQLAIRKLNSLLDLFGDMDIIKVEDFTTGKRKGFEIELSDKKLEQLIETQDRWEVDLGIEFYGRDIGGPVDMLDGSMWSFLGTLDLHRNVSRVHDVIMGKKGIAGMEDVDVASVQSLLNEALSHPRNNNDNIIVESQTKIKLDPEGMDSIEEYKMLENMLHDLWAISNAGGRQPIDGREVTVDITKARALKEKLVKAGMPDPEFHNMGLDGRMQTWVEKAVQKGLDDVLGHLDIETDKAIVVKRLMQNGILQHSVDRRGKSVGIQAPVRITKEMIRKVKPNASDDEVQSIVTAYDNVMSKLGTELIAPREDFALTDLSENQLSSIVTAEHILDSEKLVKDVGTQQEDLAFTVLSIEDNLKVLRSNIESGTADNVTEIKEMMKFEEERLRLFKNEQLSWHKTYGSGIEMSRASAHLYHFKNLQNKNGDTLYDLYKQGQTVADRGDFLSITEQIRDLQIEIANKVGERADVRQWDDRRQEAELRFEQEEVEGKIPDANNNITPDVFFNKHNITVNDIFNKGEDGAGITYDSSADALYALYSRNDQQGFSNRLFDLAEKNAVDKKIDLDLDALRNDIMAMSNLFERRFNVKRLVVNEGSGTFENAEISKGFLTDLFSEVFQGTAGDMVLLSSDYFQGGRYQNIATNTTGIAHIRNILSSDAFFATLDRGGAINTKYLKDGRITSVKDGKEYAGNIDLSTQLIEGKHYVIGVDENINIVVPEAGFDKLADSFVRWYEKNSNTPYVKNAIKKMGGAKELFKQLETYHKQLTEIRRKDGSYNAEAFSRDHKNNNEFMEDAMYTMFNVMYGEKIDGDWLQDAYFDNSTGLKGYKYKRLAQNQGYARNSKERKQMLKTLYSKTKNKRFKKLIKKYTDKDIVNVAVIDDGAKSEAGEDALGLITDNRSVAEARLEAMKDQISSEDYAEMQKLLRDSNSINAESVNGMTAVSRDFLDYLLLLNGQGNLIGESSGQKPVGLSSYTDSDGRMHVFYNKTHYFYDTKLDPFFKKNKDLDMLAFKSGAKKAKTIDPTNRNLDNEFIPISNIPKVGDKINLTKFINNLELSSGDAGVMPVQFDQSLSGTIYGKPKGANVMKQFDNWTNRKVQKDLYEWARVDMANRFAEVTIELYHPENVDAASREAMSFISQGNKDGSMSTEAPNASTAAIWLESGGVPFSEMSKGLYDALIKRRHIDNAGVFDGFTDAGGVPVIRGNLDGDLNIPVYRGDQQIKLGEANVTSTYLDRNINFKGKFGAVVGGKSKVRQRESYKNKSSLTVSFALKNDKGGRDLIVDLSTGKMMDPLNNKGKLSDAEYKDIAIMVEKLTKKLGSEKELVTWRDVHNELLGSDYKGANLAIMSVPAPRTGPHDAMVVKIKNLLDAKDGGLIELNSYDVTMRGQRDYDTDKLPFYMDTPWSAMEQSYLENGRIKEAAPITDPTMKKRPTDFDIYDNRSFRAHNQNVNNYKRLRGPVIKMQRKLSYAQRLFEQIGGIDLGDGSKIVFTKDPQKAMQRLVNDSQNVLDIYDGTPVSLEDMNSWSRKTLFENSETDGYVGVDTDQPFFQLEVTDGKESTLKTIDSEGHRMIVEKVLNDFGRLLQLESNIYEAGQAKSPRYEDMVAAYRDFKHQYSNNAEAVNWNFYHYLVHKGNKSFAEELFFNKDTDRIKAGTINNVMGTIAKSITDGPTPFLKSLDAVVGRDHLRVRESYGKSGDDYFNSGIMKLIGKRRAQVLEVFRHEGEITDQTLSGHKDTIVDDMWDKFYNGRTHEEMMVQVNNIESELRRTERSYEAEQAKPHSDDAYLAMLEEDILIKSEALKAMLDKMSITPDSDGKFLHGQTIFKGGKDRNQEFTANNFIIIRKSRNGEFVRQVEKGEKFKLGKKEVAVENAMVAKPIVEHELLDGAAFAYSVLGRYSNVTEVDLPEFRNIVKETRKAIKNSSRKLIERKGYRDWSENQAQVQAAIDAGLQKIKELALKDSDILRDTENTWIGQMPIGKESYGLDFLLSMMIPDHSSNPNEFHFSPKTGSFMPAVMAPKRSVINSVMRSIEQYQIVPNYKDFVKDFAQIHRAFYESMVAGRGFDQAMSKMQESDFRGALLHTNIKEVQNNTFMSSKDYKSMDDIFDAMPPILSDYAELYRQILQDGALTDPLTAFELRRQIIEDPSLGADAYSRIFQQSRGELIGDIFGGRQFANNKGQGQLLGEVLVTRNDVARRQVTGSKQAARGTEIRDMMEGVTGRQNENKENCNY
tara:strand:+ start:1102 stop:9987 length:8886 start_codon:yes stop_codon:yes gene_type:complete